VLSLLVRMYFEAYPPGITMPSDLRKVRNSSGSGLMMRARGDRRWYFAYHEENEQNSMSWPERGGNSRGSVGATSVCSNMNLRYSCLQEGMKIGARGFADHLDQIEFLWIDHSRLCIFEDGMFCAGLFNRLDDG
jgi:hypothetical protein